MKKILVTGGKGFIGGLLVDRLKQEGYEADIFDLANGQDLLSREQVVDTVKNYDVVFHLAAVADLTWTARSSQNMITTVDVNCLGTANLAYACALHGRLLEYASTCCVYGNQDIHPSTEATCPNPSELYAYTKLAGEEIVKGLGISMGLKYNIMRYATVYGRNMREALGVAVFFRQAMANLPITIHGNGQQTRTLTFVEDLVDAHLALLKSGVNGQTYNFTTEEEVSALDMAKKIIALTGSKSEITFIPQRVGQTFKEQISANKALAELGWKAKTSFDEGIKKTYEWLKQ